MPNRIQSAFLPLLIICPSCLVLLSIGILAQLERIKADLDCTEEEASFLGKELADAKIRIQEIWTSRQGSSQRSKSHSHEVSTGVLGGIFWS